MIRSAKVEDLPQIASLHFECFPDSFSTVLGTGNKGRLLEKYYYEYLLEFPELFLVSENEKQEITGLCMGYYCEKNSCLKKYLKNNLFAIGFRMLYLLLSGNKEAWKKLLNSGKKHTQNIVDEKVKYYASKKKGDLLSICVKAECRGTNIATDLVNEFVLTLQKNNRKVCVLSVMNDNARGISFYKKMGFNCYMNTDISSYMYKLIK